MRTLLTGKRTPDRIRPCAVRAVRSIVADPTDTVIPGAGDDEILE
jgi:hypothetical protein